MNCPIILIAVPRKATIFEGTRCTVTDRYHGVRVCGSQVGGDAAGNCCKVPEGDGKGPTASTGSSRVLVPNSYDLNMLRFRPYVARRIIWIKNLAGRSEVQQLSPIGETNKTTFRMNPLGLERQDALRCCQSHAKSSEIT